MFLCNCINKDNILNLKDFFPLIGSGIVIAIFIFDRILGYKLRKKELNRSWYFKVLLEPKLVNIDSFFIDIETQISFSITELSSLDFDSGRKEYIDSQMKHIVKFKELKRKFELEVLKPILSRYTNINSELIDVINNIENDFTSAIDSVLIKPFDLIVFTTNLYEHKAELLDILYKPIK